MIHRVEIDNFALVEHAELDLGPGLTVLTGETGAGKSILVDALEFASGGRSDRTMLRSGAEEADVSILLDCCADEESGDELLIARCLRETGRSYAKINGQLSTVGELRERMELLLAIHSQNDQQTIFRESVHQSLLDAYGATKIATVLEGWSSSRDQFNEIEARLGELFQDPETRARRRNILVFQADEIQKAALSAGEDQALLKQIKKLSAVREISNHLGRAIDELAGDESDSASGHLGRALSELTTASRYSSRIQELCDRTQVIKTDLTELGYDLVRVVERLDDSPDELQRANERLVFLRRLQDKYGANLEDVIAYGDKAAAELDRLDQTEGELARLTQEKERLLKDLKEQSGRLYEVRREVADRLSQAINDELSDLDMKNAYFAVDVDMREIADSHIPIDPQHIRFSIAPNPGEPAMPLVSIISGGEASRVLLAIKTVLATLDGVPTLIFDEIDTGISGKTTTMIGDKLKSIAVHKQVICVTHSAQIAASADCQLLIGKKVEGGRTRTTVERIVGQQRISEIARLLSGRPDDVKSRALAQDLLSRNSKSPLE